MKNFKRIYDCISNGILRVEMIVLTGVVGICLFKAGTLFFI